MEDGCWRRGSQMWSSGRHTCGWRWCTGCRDRPRRNATLSTQAWRRHLLEVQAALHHGLHCVSRCSRFANARSQSWGPEDGPRGLSLDAATAQKGARTLCEISPTPLGLTEIIQVSSTAPSCVRYAHKQSVKLYRQAEQSDESSVTPRAAKLAWAGVGRRHPVKHPSCYIP